MLHLFSDCLQLSSKALGLRLPLDHELVLPGLGAVVREAQEVEGLRASLPSGGSVVGGEPPELDQPGLALMERQAELQQPVFEIHEELLPICLELTAEHHIICVPMRSPEGQRRSAEKVQEIIAEIIADARRLGSHTERLPVGSTMFPAGAVMTEARRVAKNIAKAKLKAQGVKVNYEVQLSEITKIANVLIPPCQ